AVAGLRSHGGTAVPGRACAGWVERLADLHSALADAQMLHLIDQLPRRGDARKVVRRLLHLSGEGQAQLAVEMLASVAPLGKLDRELLLELSDHLPSDLLQLLADGPGDQKASPPPAHDMEDLEPVLSPAPSDDELGNCSKPRWQDWAAGLETGDKWHLFRRINNEWRQQRLIEGISKGRQAKLLGAFAKGGGQLDKVAALKLERFNFSDGDVDAVMDIIKAEMSKLRKIIRKAIRVADKKADPLPYDETQKGWRAEIQIGYAVQEDRQHLGGERRLRF